ncbi:amidohydrolase [Actinacidiphila paucisporea]|uniref:Peptidase M20 domain-containing protein 2 n=1 Tax=Actinacidiphila paucisporea TaxID=310782 RepID=A0A1M7P0Z8_9ACTN|nr:amidohydrolase [Actinacidiphila paucisporea]SHN10109.1 amidohydrolase [Actinacidiphila paucisporea]
MDSGEDLYGAAERAVEARADALWEVALRLHRSPETAYQEHAAARLLGDELRAGGFEVTAGVAGMPTAFVAHGGAAARPAVALLMEYDALPELGHACGHNLIAAAGLGAALAAQEVAGAAGRVLAVGSPAEESGGGKVALAAAGVFDDVDAALMVHPGVRDQTRAPLTAQAQIRVRFHGRSAHPTGNPAEGVDALAALVETFTMLGAVGRRFPPGSHVQGIITRGGVATNIVPDLAEGLFGCRGLTVDALADVIHDVTRCAQAAAAFIGAEVEVERDGAAYEHFRNSEPLAARFAEHVRRSGRVMQPPPAGTYLGSSDIGDVSGRVPAIHPFLAIMDADGSDHTVPFAEAAASERGRRAMLDGAKALACLAVDTLTSEAVRDEAWRFFHAQRSAGR